MTRSVARLAALVFTAVCLSSCVRLTIAWAPLAPRGAEARPDVLAEFAADAPVASVADWEERRAPLLRGAFERDVYGAAPRLVGVRKSAVRPLDGSVYGDGVVAEEWTVEFTVETAAGEREEARFFADIILPPGPGPHPAILKQSFSSRASALPDMDVSAPDGGPRPEGAGEIPGIFLFVFGRYIMEPPVEMIVGRGYALILLYPSEVAPDAREPGLAALSRLSGRDDDQLDRWGAVGAWAFVHSRMVDLLDADPRFDDDATIAYGHSRYGKSALVAAAYDERIDGVLSHQSGTGGASLNRKKPGESVKSITKSYPHWFSPAYGAFGGRTKEMEIDQHQLLALIAPRPILLGNARRDVWSDPNGAFRAAQGANPAYALYGSRGMTAERLDEFRPADDIAFWIRPGTHGVTEEDWPVFLEFLDAHFR
ncbi:MAG: alpha/beta hydrolase [Pseudomonadota bacterium]